MDDNFINIPIDIYEEATTKNKLKDMETVRKVVELSLIHICLGSDSSSL